MLRNKLRAMLSIEQKENIILPVGYRRVEYLESTGTQYINTNILVDAVDIGFELDYSIKPNALIVSQYSMASRKDNGASYGFGGSMSNAYITATYNQNLSNVIISTTRDTNRHLVQNLSTGCFFDGVYKGKNVRQDFNNAPVYIFAQNPLNKISGGIRVYGSKIYKGTKVIASYVPCLDNNYRPCMYDAVSRQAFYNQGTGEFLYGKIIT